MQLKERAWPAPSGCRTSRWRCCARRSSRSARRSPATRSSTTCCSANRRCWTTRAARASRSPPIARWPGRLAQHAPLAAIAQKHGVTPAQVALKWLLDQDGVAAIPKASRPENQQANLDSAEDHAGRRGPGRDREAPEGWADRQSGLCAGLGCRCLAAGSTCGRATPETAPRHRRHEPVPVDRAGSRQGPARHPHRAAAGNRTRRRCR